MQSIATSSPVSTVYRMCFTKQSKLCLQLVFKLSRQDTSSVFRSALWFIFTLLAGNAEARQGTTFYTPCVWACFCRQELGNLGASSVLFLLSLSLSETNNDKPIARATSSVEEKEIKKKRQPSSTHQGDSCRF